MYTNQTFVESYIKRELTDNEAILIDDLIDEVSQFITTYTGRNWLPIGEELDEYAGSFSETYDGNGRQELQVNDFLSLEYVDILDSYGSLSMRIDDPTQWILYPLNKDTKQAIRLRQYRFPIGNANIEINAVWGSGEVPAGVRNIATALVGKQILKVSSSTGNFKSETIEGYSYTLQSGAEIDADTQSLISGLDKYKKYVL